jgi:hypothetical protein
MPPVHMLVDGGCFLIAAMQLARSNEYAFASVLLLCDLQYYYRRRGFGTADVRLACGSTKTNKLKRAA